MKVGFVGDVHLMENPPRSWKLDYFDTTVQDLVWVIDQNDYTICLGDLIHKYSINDEHKQQLVAALASRPGKFGTIWGNHDLMNMNLASAAKGSIKLLADTHVFILHNEDFELAGVPIHIIPLKFHPEVPILNPTRDSILLGHFYYEYPLDPKMSITADQLRDCGYTYVILGHDHEPHPMVQSGHSTLLRFGSLGRNTSHQYNLERKPQYVQFELVDGHIKSCQLLEIPAPSPQEIFHPDAFVAHSPVNSFAANIDDLINQFTRASSKENLVTIQSALRELQTPEPAFLYIKHMHEQAQVAF